MTTPSQPPWPFEAKPLDLQPTTQPPQPRPPFRDTFRGPAGFAQQGVGPYTKLLAEDLMWLDETLSWPLQWQ